MYRIKTLNKISEKGMALLSEAYTVTEEQKADAIVLRSYNMHDSELEDSVKVIARAGAGVNNIPFEAYAEKGVVVCNTPGANANAVKELVILGLLLSSRKVIEGINWAASVKEIENVPKLIEMEKGKFAGQELTGKKIGVIGLGAIGVMVSNTCIALGMEVHGYDPFISVNSAWGLDQRVKRAFNLDYIMENCDYVTLHVPLIEQTKNMITDARLKNSKKGMKLLNFARGGLVKNQDIKEAIERGNISCYVTDFPDEELLDMDNVICIPHLGASTAESEENCAVMAVNSIKEYLENGNIVNSVNYPNCYMGSCSSAERLSLCHKNIPNMVGQIASILAASNINISNMTNQSKGNYAYTLIDIEGKINNEIMDKIKGIDGMLKIRVISGSNN